MEEEYLASELKKLIGWGVNPRRLPYLPVLRGLSGVNEEAPLLEIGYAMLRYLTKQIDSLPGMTFQGKVYPADKTVRIFRLLLQIEGTGLKAPARRGRVILLLDQYFTVDSFRQPYGPERLLVNILAKHLLSNFQSSTALAA